MCNEEWIKKKKEILKLCEGWCKLNDPNSDINNPPINSKDRRRIMRETEELIRGLLDTPTDKVYSCKTIINWYWNTMYLKNYSDSEWIDFWFFGITHTHQNGKEDFDGSRTS